MQYQVDPMHQTQENGQKPHFWLFGSFKKAFFVNFEWSSMGDTMANSCAPFSSIKICNIESIRCPKREKLAETHMDHSKGPKRVDASHGKDFKKRTGSSTDMRFSRWYSQNIVVSSKIFSRKLLPTVFHQNLIKVKKGPFLARFRDYWMIQIFPGKTAVYVSYSYSKDHSCKKAKKSLARFSRYFAD